MHAVHRVKQQCVYKLGHSMYHSSPYAQALPVVDTPYIANLSWL